MKMFLLFFVSLTSLEAFSQACVQVSIPNIYKTTCKEAVERKYNRDCDQSKPYELEYDRNADPEYNKLYDDYQTLLKVGPNDDPYTFHFNNEKTIKVDKAQKCKSKDLPIKCFQKWKFKRTKALLKKIEKTESWKKSFKDINQLHRQYLNEYEKAMLSEWSYQLDVDKTSGLNQILEQLKDSPLSPKSRRKMLHTFNSFSNSKLGILRNKKEYQLELDRFNAYYFAGYELGKIPLPSPIKTVNVSNLLVNHHIGEKNKLFTQWVISHEIAHAYTIKATGRGLPLSKDTRKDLTERHKACLYNGNTNETKPIGEDLADLVAESILDRLNTEITGEDLDGLFTSLCSFERYTIGQSSKDGHSSPINRIYNLVRYNKKIQKQLQCYVPGNVCSIKIDSP